MHLCSDALYRCLDGKVEPEVMHTVPEKPILGKELHRAEQDQE